MLGMQLDFPARDIVNRCLEAGFIINVTSDNVLRFLPPYIITKKEIGKFIKALDKIFAEVAKERAEGSRFGRGRRSLADVHAIDRN
jgi:acetylornithine/succinyldiaminopimelate/putrescine aminotransferase